MLITSNWNIQGAEVHIAYMTLCMYDEHADWSQLAHPTWSSLGPVIREDLFRCAMYEKEIRKELKTKMDIILFDLVQRTSLFFLDFFFSFFLVFLIVSRSKTVNANFWLFCLTFFFIGGVECSDCYWLACSTCRDTPTTHDALHVEHATW